MDVSETDDLSKSTNVIGLANNFSVVSLWLSDCEWDGEESGSEAGQASASSLT